MLSRKVTSLRKDLIDSLMITNSDILTMFQCWNFWWKIPLRARTFDKCWNWSRSNQCSWWILFRRWWWRNLQSRIHCWWKRIHTICSTFASGSRSSLVWLIDNKVILFIYFGFTFLWYRHNISHSDTGWNVCVYQDQEQVPQFAWIWKWNAVKLLRQLEELSLFPMRDRLVQVRALRNLKS